jgi:hypothetical protein
MKFTDTNDLFVVLPITMVVAYAKTDGTIISPSLGSSNLCSIKTYFEKFNSSRRFTGKRENNREYSVFHKRGSTLPITE